MVISDHAAAKQGIKMNTRTVEAIDGFDLHSLKIGTVRIESGPVGSISTRYIEWMQSAVSVRPFWKSFVLEDDVYVATNVRLEHHLIAETSAQLAIIFDTQAMSNSGTFESVNIGELGELVGSLVKGSLQTLIDHASQQDDVNLPEWIGIQIDPDWKERLLHTLSMPTSFPEKT